MIAKRFVKANRKVVNQRLPIAPNGTRTANQNSRSAQSRRRGKLWWAKLLPIKAPTIWISGVFIKFSDCQTTCSNKPLLLLMTFCRRFWTRSLQISYHEE